MNVLINPIECKKLKLVKFPSPRDEKSLQDYFYDDDNLSIYEIKKYSDPFRSWFIDDLLCKEGHYNLLTKIDALYILLPQLIKFASDKYRTLEDVCDTYNSSLSATKDENEKPSSLNVALNASLNIDWNLVCDTKELDDQLYVRFNLEKTLDWLTKKHAATMEALKETFDGEPSKATLISYSCDLISEYLVKDISDRFKTKVKTNVSNLPEENKVKADIAGPSMSNSNKTNAATKRGNQQQQQQQQKQQRLSRDKSQTSIKNFFGKIDNKN